MIEGEAITAAAHLVDRAGGKDFEIGYLHDDVPIEDAGWYATASWKGRKTIVEDHPSPTAAALALASKIIEGASCRCGRTATIIRAADGLGAESLCRWSLQGEKWEPGCDAEPIPMTRGTRGDLDAMAKALRKRHQ